MFANITLIVHCRERLEVCQQRRPLLQSYSAFFKEVIFLLKDSFNSSWTSARRCYGAGDPYWCISEEMRRTSASGILYMQFDVALAPCELANNLNTEKVGHFQELFDRYISFDSLDRCASQKAFFHPSQRRLCFKGWNGELRRSLQDSAVVLGKLIGSERTLLLERLRAGIWISPPLFLYVPYRAFAAWRSASLIYKDLAIRPDMATGTLLELSLELAQLEFQSFDCASAAVPSRFRCVVNSRSEALPAVEEAIRAARAVEADLGGAEGHGSLVLPVLSLVPLLLILVLRRSCRWRCARKS